MKFKALIVGCFAAIALAFTVHADLALVPPTVVQYTDTITSGTVGDIVTATGIALPTGTTSANVTSLNINTGFSAGNYMAVIVVGGETVSKAITSAQFAAAVSAGSELPSGKTSANLRSLNVAYVPAVGSTASHFVERITLK